MITCMFANHKGGCGKTTLTHHLGEYLAEKGLRVLVWDADKQRNTYRRFARIEYKAAQCPIIEWSKGCRCVAQPGEWAVSESMQTSYDVVLVDTAPNEDLPEGPTADVVMVPVRDLDSALGAGTVVDGILNNVEEGIDAPPIFLVKNALAGGKRLHRLVADMESGEGVEICPVEVPCGDAIIRTTRGRPAWKDPYKSRDAKMMREWCAWAAGVLGVE